ncbi:hypothetical protein AOQ84DRAFT_22904 [Glonium stellatum]|uniref:J domain-containing protein n=1 Tax=Glonium stellatum TaxID=574774 RepID=A0A8E2JYQ7_9PEZI|nr:hypothetical protein AOQ84DRAFT_22904 [Glonium stellatum]
MAYNELVSFFVWQYVIPFAVGWIQAILYGIFIRAGDPKPQPGSAKFVKHRRLILMSVYAVYLILNIYEVDRDIQTAGNLYQDLSVPFDVDDRALQSRFRRLTVQYHPDKISSAADRSAANDYYVHLKNARDIIIDPVKRFAYDRFGPEVFQCERLCVTIRDYEIHALYITVIRYGLIAALLVAVNALGYMKDGAYWRYLAIVSLLTFEFRTALRPDYPPILTKLVNPLLTKFNLHPPYLPFQVITLMRRASYTFAVFLGLLIPLYRQQPQQPASKGEDSDEARHQQLDRLANLTREIQADATRLLDLESIPFKADEKKKGELRKALKSWMVQNVVHAEKDVRNAIGMSLTKRRQGAPAGAKGTK